MVKTTGTGLKTTLLIYCRIIPPPALSSLTMAISGRLNHNREGLTKESLRLKKGETESYTGVALNRLALLLQEVLGLYLLLLQQDVVMTK